MAVTSRVQSEKPAPHPHGHLLIAGTGRAGTSFLVRLLTELGLDTHVSRCGDGQWDVAAQAGLEDEPMVEAGADRPRVIKSPWAYQYIEQALADRHLLLDAVIVPMRDLVEATASRTIVELRAVHEQAPWMAKLDKTWQDWGYTPGGTVYSLNPLDQSRLVAVGFHRLIQQLVQADVPLLFLAFPRCAEDPDYVFNKLSPILPAHVTRERVSAAYRKVADNTLVRVSRELRETSDAPPVNPHPASEPSFAELDNIALKREITRLRELLAATDAAARVHRSSYRRRVARLLMLVAGALGGT